MGLHPWEFDEYTIHEYLLKRKGAIKMRRRELQQEFQHFRLLAYYVIAPYLPAKDKKKSLDKLIPDIYEEPEPEKDVKETYLSIKERLRKAGLLNGGKRD